VWVSKHIFVKPAANKHYCVDAAGLNFRDPDASGPGEISMLFVEKSAEAIVSQFIGRRAKH